MPTIRRCCIVGCLSNSRQNPQLQFFQFPKPENPFSKLWKQACHASLSRILPFKKPVVCALHFHPNCIGGRRLTASAVPSLRLEVPSNLKAVEQQAMVEEIERSRKCAYINAVVYEWLVRANLNPQLRGSITHGMIKEKAETAKQIIGSGNFVADNRWLNRFRETHLTGFAQKLATNQLKPLGPSLWIPDIVQELQHLFPPTSADRVAKFENIPEQYMDYMQQYGEYEEDDDQDQSQHEQSYQEQQQQSHYQQQQHSQYQHNQSGGGYDPYALHQPQGNYNYDDFYYEGQNQQQHNNYNHHQSPVPVPSRPSSHSPPQQPQQQSTSNRSSPFLAKRPSTSQDEDNNSRTYPAKRPRSSQDEDNNSRNSHTNNSSPTEQIEDLTDGPEILKQINGKTKTNGDSPSTPNGNSSAASSPKPTNGQTNGHASPGKSSSKDLDSYEEALEYLKPLEDFALFKENFRAIGLISQLEAILRKGNRRNAPDLLTVE